MRSLSNFSVLLAFSIFSAATAATPDYSGLSITNYQLVSTQPVSRTQSMFTYRADLVNNGTAQPALSANFSTQFAGLVLVPGRNTLHFPPVAAAGRTTSTNTFSIVLDRRLALEAGDLSWKFGLPIAAAGPGQAVTVGTVVTLDGSESTNPTSIGALIYDWFLTAAPEGSRAALQSPHSPFPSFIADVLGDYVLSLSVTNYAGTDTASVTVHAGPAIPKRPMAQAGPGQTVKPGNTVTLNGSGSASPEGSPLTYEWSLLVHPPRSAASLSSKTGVNPTFIADQPGAYIAQLIVRDGQRESEPKFVTITDRNTRPIANAGSPQLIQSGETLQLDGSGSTDADGNSLTYRWSLNSVPEGSRATLSDGTAVNPTLVADLPGTYVAQLVVNDGFDESDPVPVTVIAGGFAAQRKPTAVAGQPQSIRAQSVVMLKGSGADPQGHSLTYRWSLIAKPAGSSATLTDSASPTPALESDLPGTYIAQLVVNNGVLDSDPDTVTLSSSNIRPRAHAGPNQSVVRGERVTLDAAASSDPERAPLTYSWSLLSAPKGSQATLLFPDSAHPTFVADSAGTYVAQVIAHDGELSSEPATVSIAAASVEALMTRHTDTHHADTTQTVPHAIVPSSVMIAPAAASGVPNPQAQYNVGFFLPSGPTWALDSNGSGGYDASDRAFSFAGQPGATAVTGDWNGDGRTKVGFYLDGFWVLDYNGNGVWDGVAGGDKFYAFGGADASYVPIVGDWNGDGRTKVGFYRNGSWALDTNGNGTFDGTGPGQDSFYGFGGNGAGELPVLGDWNGDGRTKVGYFFNGKWVLDYDGNGVYTVDDKNYTSFPYNPGDQPVVGDWSGDGKIKIGIYRGGFWVLDFNGNGTYDGVGAGGDKFYGFGGNAGEVPKVADWNGSGTSKIGIYVNGFWVVDFNGNGSYDGTGPGGDRFIPFGGGAGYQPIIGRWSVAQSGSSLTITGGTIGKDLQVPINVSLPSPPPSQVEVIITSDNANVLLGGGSQPGTLSVNVTVPAGATSFTTFAKGLAASGTANLTATSAGYANGTAIVNLSPSGFVIAGPNGTGGSFNVNQGSSVPLAVSAAALDGSGKVIQVETLRAGINPVAVNIGNSNTSAGAVAPASLTFNGGDDTLNTKFTASSSATGTTVIAVNVPAGFSMAPGGSVVATLMTATVSAGNVTVGHGLETTSNISLQGVASTDLTVVVTSNDPSKVLLSLDGTTAGQPSITTKIGAGRNRTLDFFVYGVGSAGVSGYTAAVTGFGNTDALVTIANSGFVLSSPFGVGADFFTTTLSAPGEIDVFPAVLDAEGKPTVTQAIAGGTKVNVDIKSSLTSVGTITTSPVSFAGGSFQGITQFQPAAVGTTTISASAPIGFGLPKLYASLGARVGAPKVVVQSVQPLGNRLEVQTNLFLSAPAPAGDLNITLLSNDSNLLQFSSTSTGAGSGMLVLKIPAGQNGTTFFLYGKADSGTATYTASAPGFESSTGSVVLAPSGIIVGGPSGPGYDFTTLLTAGPAQLSVSTAVLDSNTGAFLQTQPLQGGASLTVSLTNSNAFVGSITTPVTITPGSDTGNSQFTPLAPGETTVTVTRPAPFGNPTNDTSVLVRVQ